MLEEGEHFCLEEYSFKKDRALTISNNQPFFKAPSDGHYFDESGEIIFVFYAEDKPQMKLDVLKNLSWPKYKDLLTLRSSEHKKKAMISRGRQQIPNVTIILDSKKGQIYSFTKLNHWMQSIQT